MPKHPVSTTLSLFEKIWSNHMIRDLGDGYGLIHIDRLMMNDISGVRGFSGIERRGLQIRNPELCAAVVDHTNSTQPGRDANTTPQGREHIHLIRDQTRRWGVQLYDLDQSDNGIVHVVAPEQGLVLPGMTFACGDSHTCTNGGVGAMAWGIGTSDLELGLATQTAILRRPGTMRIRVEGKLMRGVTAKDIILYLIGKLGANAGVDKALEFTGSVVRAMDVEARLTLCNMAIEMGSLIGMVGPDETTYGYLYGRPSAPSGDAWDRAVAHWRGLPTDDRAVFDQDIALDAGNVVPMVTWGNSSDTVVAVDGVVPDPDATADPVRRRSMESALSYMGLRPGQRLSDLPVDWVFIGSCTNSRLSDLRAAAGLVRGRKVATGVQAWVSPGSVPVKRAAEAEGLDRVFTDAGFQWREPGCSLCLAANGECVPAGQRSVSTTNRSFVGRQGKGARTHLASPLTAVASAIRGCIADPRLLES